MDNDGISYKKAFELLMCATIMKTLAPSSTEPFGGSPDLCIRCMQRGRHLVYGDDGEERIISIDAHTILQRIKDLIIREYDKLR